MKLFLLALKDYLQDCYHDYLVNEVNKLGCKMCDKVTTLDSKTKHKITKWSDAFTWKEGNFFHYYKQRKIALNIKKRNKNESI